MVLTDDEFVFDVAVFIIAKFFVDGIVVLGLFVELFDVDLENKEAFSGFVIAIEDMFVDVIDGGVLVVVVKLFDIDAEVFVINDVFHVIVFGVILLIAVANDVLCDMLDGIVFVLVFDGVIVGGLYDGVAFVIAIAEDDVADGARFVLVIGIMVVCIEVWSVLVFVAVI